MLQNRIRTLARGVSNTVRALSITPETEVDFTEGETKPNIPKEPINVLDSEDFFNVRNIFTVRQMFDAKVHYGHKVVSVHENMRPFLFGSRLGQAIFDLDITSFHLQKALNYCAHVAYRGGIFLFIANNKQNTLLVERTAKECGEFAHARYWRSGTFTSSINVFHTETRLPDVVIFMNTLTEKGHEHPAVIEASKILIPSVAVVDSNCNPNCISYPVPGNDDTPSSVEFFCKAFSTAILRGKEYKKHNAKKSVPS